MWLNDLTEQLLLNWRWIGLGLLLFLVGVVLSMALVLGVVVYMPADHFLDPAPGKPAPPKRLFIVAWCRWCALNVIALLLILVGIILAMPGVPGQGLLTIMVGVLLLQFPGKRRFERKLVERPWVFNSLNRIRQRFGKPPLRLKQEHQESGTPSPFTG